MSKDIPALSQQANRLLAQGRQGDALQAFREIVEAAPEQANAWFNLGYLLKREGRYEQALHAYGQALHARVDNPEQVHLNRAVILSECLHRDEGARHELQAALALVPDYRPALLNLGNLHEELGERGEAMRCYQRILDLDDGKDVHASYANARYEALARLVHLHRPSRLDDPLLLALRHSCGVREIAAETRANLLFELGRACDALRQYDHAFAAFEAGKRHAHLGIPPYDRGETRRRTDAMIAAFPQPVRDAERKHLASGKPSPLFICGMFRSGSTLLEQVLATHPAIVPGGELDTLPRMVATKLAPFPASMEALSSEEFAALVHEYQNRIRSLLPDKRPPPVYVVDKRPDNYWLIGLIKRLFPDARILHTQRNPLDNALSVFMHHLNPRTFAYAGRLADIGHHYGEYRRLMSHWKSLYLDDIHDFDYDAFVAAPRATLEPLLQFLGIPWNDGFLEFHRQGNAVRTASYWQVRRPLHGEASGRWRNYEPYLSALFESLEEAGIELPR